MLRKIARSTARHNMEQQEIHIFGKYAPQKDVLVRSKRTGKLERKDVMKSFFARSWRAYL